MTRSALLKAGRAERLCRSLAVAVPVARRRRAFGGIKVTGGVAAP